MSVIFRQRMSKGLAGHGQLHLGAHAGRQHRLQRRRHSDESVLVEGRLRQLQLGHPPPRGRHVRLRHSVLLRRQPGPEEAFGKLAGQRNHHLAQRTAVQRHHRHRYREYRFERHLPSRTWSRRRPPTAAAGTWSAASTRPPSRSRICTRANPTNFAYGNAGRNILRGPGAAGGQLLAREEFPDQRAGADSSSGSRRSVCSTTRISEIRRRRSTRRRSETSPALPAIAKSSLEPNFRSKRTLLTNEMRYLTTILLIAACVAAQPRPKYDLLLKGGHVIDPKNNANRVMDVAIAGGKVARVDRGHSLRPMRRRPSMWPDYTLRPA